MGAWREFEEVPGWRGTTGHGLEPMPEWFRGIVVPVLSDMQLPEPIDLGLAYEPAWTCHPTTYEWVRIEGEGMLLVWEPGELGDSGYLVLAGVTPAAERMVAFADWLQDQVYPESEAAWGQARPPCPGHAHPASPREIAGEAWWVCPVDERQISLIGTLTAG